jgi:RNA polymerase sigma-70 factor, ECF subfamily
MKRRERFFAVSPSSQSTGQGDVLGADALFRAHAGFVASFLRRIGTASADVDDLVQEVFLIAHRKGGFVVGSGHPKSWLAAIAFRVASTSRRTQRRRREDADTGIDGIHSPHADAARVLEGRAALQRVQQALDKLTLDDRAIFVLFELEGLSCEAIAAAFEIPVGTTYSRLHNVRKRFIEAHAGLEREDTAVVRLRTARTQ